jgi:hypothetical protein
MPKLLGESDSSRSEGGNVALTVEAAKDSAHWSSRRVENKQPRKGSSWARRSREREEDKGAYFLKEKSKEER